MHILVITLLNFLVSYSLFGSLLLPKKYVTHNFKSSKILCTVCQGRQWDRMYIFLNVSEPEKDTGLSSHLSIKKDWSFHVHLRYVTTRLQSLCVLQQPACPRGVVKVCDKAICSHYMGSQSQTQILEALVSYVDLSSGDMGIQ